MLTDMHTDRYSENGFEKCVDVIAEADASVKVREYMQPSGHLQIPPSFLTTFNYRDLCLFKSL